MKMKLFLLCIILTLSCFLFSCSKPNKANINHSICTPIGAVKIENNNLYMCEGASTWKFAKVEGVASWYGKEFQGRTMANGQRFDRNAYTCASNYYPLGTVLSVYFGRTQRKVTVVVTDRGPSVSPRVIDLSERAARDLGLTKYGIGWVVIMPKEIQ